MLSSSAHSSPAPSSLFNDTCALPFAEYSGMWHLHDLRRKDDSEPEPGTARTPQAPQTEQLNLAETTLTLGHLFVSAAKSLWIGISGDKLFADFKSDPFTGTLTSFTPRDGKVRSFNIRSGTAELRLDGLVPAWRLVQGANPEGPCVAAGRKAVEEALNDDAWLSTLCPISLPTPREPHWYLDDSKTQGQVTIDLDHNCLYTAAGMNHCLKNLKLELTLERHVSAATGCDGTPTNAAGEDTQPLLETDT